MIIKNIEDITDITAASSTNSKLGLITKQLKAFESEELGVWDKARDMYTGRMYTAVANDREASILRCSLNILFAICESAISALLPPNPQVTCTITDEGDEEKSTAPETYVNKSLKLADYKQEQKLALTDGLLCGRAFYKTTWDDETGYPCVRAVDPRLVHFDLTARRVKDIKYWFELSLLSEEEFRSRVTAKKYKLPKDKDLEDVHGTKYPAFLLGAQKDGQPKQYKELHDWQPWIQIYEFYDCQAGTVSHWCEAFDAPLMVTKMTYLPYTLLTLNSNAQDCRGLSEALLTKSNIQDVDECMTLWLNIVRHQMPHIGYDSSALSGDEMDLWSKAKLGAVTPLKGTPGRPISEFFAQLPVPLMPPDMEAYQQKLESNISYVSALADNARGQISGAKTATELALIQSQLQNRLRTRQTAVDSATTDIAEKIIFLAGSYMKEGKRLKTTSGDKGWIAVSRKSLRDVELEFDVTPYSPLESNRAVMEDRWFRALAYMQARPNAFVWATIDQEFVEMFRLDPKVLLPPAPSDAPMPPAGGMDAPPAIAPEAIKAAQDAGANPQQIAAAIRAGQQG